MKKVVFLFIAILLSACNSAQSIISKEIILKHDLVNIQELDPTLLVDLKYSTTDNFMETDVYGELEICYMRKIPGKMLVKAHDLLKKNHPDLRLLIYDGLRPRSIQWILWNTLIDVPESERSNFVANPKSGSIHNFGAAIDLTVTTKDGIPLDMGTHYDYFGKLAFPRLEDSLLVVGDLTLEQVSNRDILRDAMTGAGFGTISTEWWHFNAFPYKITKQMFSIIE
ncbi:MAG: M15 family metallopeptidase [Candidatus Marinimicrobia bacterium]|jgi:D-alanyl-D-alanine dipeptidase|nr:M15 family metallopeptidase [Candidatus Neomarinimicrobiota bacterium]MBT3501637.1 M15 family metallopeptidase [Candidatus Neomarinimicrobiota bacterium]MBT3839815.1 M15 family metallopeptidase [Candidatus Neomarinimicrobiota bacterium]MBT3998403.1 M15 family metallopeptidase [Candidatus Neomarinimicrobiota bacterium]MBT4282277.1 M15 family metallopeptidase [Candidatus Neomarinimicrobiota bacterium]